MATLRKAGGSVKDDGGEKEARRVGMLPELVTDTRLEEASRTEVTERMARCCSLVWFVVEKFSLAGCFRAQRAGSSVEHGADEERAFRLTGTDDAETTPGWNAASRIADNTRARRRVETKLLRAAATLNYRVRVSYAVTFRW